MSEIRSEAATALFFCVCRMRRQRHGSIRPAVPRLIRQPKHNGLLESGAGAHAAAHKHPHEQFVRMVKGIIDFLLATKSEQ